MKQKIFCHDGQCIDITIHPCEEHFEDRILVEECEMMERLT